MLGGVEAAEVLGVDGDAAAAAAAPLPPPPPARGCSPAPRSVADRDEIPPPAPARCAGTAPPSASSWPSSASVPAVDPDQPAAGAARSCRRCPSRRGRRSRRRPRWSCPPDCRPQPAVAAAAEPVGPAHGRVPRRPARQVALARHVDPARRVDDDLLRHRQIELVRLGRGVRRVGQDGPVDQLDRIEGVRAVDRDGRSLDRDVLAVVGRVRLADDRVRA